MAKKDGFSRYARSLCARCTRLAGSVRDREMGTRRPTSSSVITTSSACRHVAMLPFLVQIFPNEESTNIIPVPWMLASSRPVSRNRSSRKQNLLLRYLGLAWILATSFILGTGLLLTWGEHS